MLTVAMFPQTMMMWMVARLGCDQIDWLNTRVRDHCWHAGSVVGEGTYKKADSKTLY